MSDSFRRSWKQGDLYVCLYINIYLFYKNIAKSVIKAVLQITHWGGGLLDSRIPKVVIPYDEIPKCFTLKVIVQKILQYDESSHLLLCCPDLP